jgi:LacI family transcriptional regulator
MRAPTLVSRRRGPRQVAVIVESSNAYARNLLRGVVNYVREHQPWSLHLVEQSRGEAAPGWLTEWKGDGILARIENQSIADAVLATGLPAVDLSAGRFASTLPWVETDDRKIAALAYQHLSDRGFQHFAFCGDDRFNWSRARGEEFTRLAQGHGTKVQVFPPAGQRVEVAAQIESLERWVKQLPKPIGVMACYDIRGQQLLDACRSAGVAVPEEVAVIGVDDDDLLCELTFPPLSSVVPNAIKTGYSAAALLDGMMHGAPREVVEIRVAPTGITARQSTDILAMEDRLVAGMMRFIRQHACDPIAVKDVVHEAAVSRRVLEKRFGQAIGRTPHELIVETRVSRVKTLLIATKLSLEEIAARTGFEHPEYMTVVFKRIVGDTPGRFRRAVRTKAR